MKSFFIRATAVLTALSALAAVVGAIFYLGSWTKSREAQLTILESKLDLLTQQLATSDKELNKVKEIALTAKVRAEGVKSQTAVLGRELKVDVETPFQQTIAREETQRSATAPTQPPADVEAPPINVTLNDFTFKSQGCERQGANMVCRITATNLMDDDRPVTLDRRGGTLYDKSNDARVSYTSYFHGKQHKMVVPAKSSSNIVYTFTKVPKKSIPKSIAFVIDENGKFNDLLRTWITN